MASQRRKERRRLERERRNAIGDSLRAYLGLCENAKIDQQTTAQMNLPSPVAVEVPTPDDVPLLVERHSREVEAFGATYEEANWAKLSPTFREAHNRLRQLRGMDPIPPPAIDLYRPPPVVRPTPAQLEALSREASIAKMEFLSGGKKGAGIRHMAPGHEGFSIDGQPVKF